MTTILTFKDVRNVQERYRVPTQSMTIETLPVGKIKGTQKHKEKVEQAMTTMNAKFGLLFLGQIRKHKVSKDTALEGHNALRVIREDKE